MRLWVIELVSLWSLCWHEISSGFKIWGNQGIVWTQDLSICLTEHEKGSVLSVISIADKTAALYRSVSIFNLWSVCGISFRPVVASTCSRAFVDTGEAINPLISPLLILWWRPTWAKKTFLMKFNIGVLLFSNALQQCVTP